MVLEATFTVMYFNSGVCLNYRWILSKAKKDDTDDEIAKYDGESSICSRYSMISKWHLVSITSLFLKYSMVIFETFIHAYNVLITILFPHC